MTELTITLEDDVADWAHAEAARRNTGVSQLVGELLAEKMRHHDRYEQAMKQALTFESWGVSDTPFRRAVRAMPSDSTVFVDAKISLLSRATTP